MVKVWNRVWRHSLHLEVGSCLRYEQPVLFLCNSIEQNVAMCVHLLFFIDNTAHKQIQNSHRAQLVFWHINFNETNSCFQNNCCSRSFMNLTLTLGQECYFSCFNRQDTEAQQAQDWRNYGYNSHLSDSKAHVCFPMAHSSWSPVFSVIYVQISVTWVSSSHILNTI